ncbi:class I histocompatibility antigen, F10 alpha chain-like isoform X2 [Xyrauchen texanus]|uniref:class I histocompatibility antigen, F10 alpha chain-like isoform X2 n=1 Tax=Xyrauchen texanus TaxID=154827 RepID=UPI0022427AC4|nr:class I histocompatibility antigen, F10 alpha chain-like isoform X2 [Xyrauchen texanus]
MRSEIAGGGVVSEETVNTLNMLTYVCFLVIISVSGGNAAIHSLMYTYLVTSGIEDGPVFMTVGFVDGEPIVYYDSNVYRVIPQQKWLNMFVESDYWDKETQISIRFQELYKINIDTAKERFNQNEGVHTYQVMYGCEWDDETNETNGFLQEGFDGVDLLSLDLKEMRFISLVPEGFPTQNKWNNDSAWLENLRFYFSDLCIGWLKKYLLYAWSSLKKIGFYPIGVTITWLKNGQIHHKDVELGELLPNEDGTFQKTSTLTVTPYELKTNKYSCVVEHQSKTFMEHLTEDEIRAIHGNSLPNGIIVGVVVAAVGVLLVIICCTACMVNQKKIESESSSDTTRRPKDMDQSVLFLGETMLQAF